MIALFNIAEVVSDPASIIAPLQLIPPRQTPTRQIAAEIAKQTLSLSVVRELPNISSLNFIYSHSFIITLNKFSPKTMLCLALLNFLDHGIPELFICLVIPFMIFVANFAPIGDEVEEREVGEGREGVDEVSSWSADIRETF